jgi:hypothetical protein
MSESRTSFFSRLAIAAAAAPALTLWTLAMASLFLRQEHSAAEPHSDFIGTMIVDVVMTGIVVMPFGAIFGWVGAFLFLWPTFLWASAQRSSRLAFSLAGGVAGLLHTGTGWAFQHLVDGLTWQLQQRLKLALITIRMVGGFLLAGDNHLVGWLLLVAPASGIVAGLVSATLVRISGDSV